MVRLARLDVPGLEAILVGLDCQDQQALLDRMAPVGPLVKSVPQEILGHPEKAVRSERQE